MNQWRKMSNSDRGGALIIVGLFLSLCIGLIYAFIIGPSTDPHFYTHPDNIAQSTANTCKNKGNPISEPMEAQDDTKKIKSTGSIPAVIQKCKGKVNATAPQELARLECLGELYNNYFYELGDGWYPNKLEDTKLVMCIGDEESGKSVYGGTCVNCLSGYRIATLFEMRTGNLISIGEIPTNSTIEDLKKFILNW